MSISPIALSPIRPLKLLASTAVAALLIGWTVGIGAQAADPQQALPPLPQASSTAPPTTASTTSPQPLGQDDVREVQNQLTSLGLHPGPADGQIGPSTITAVQQYDSSHGGNGQAQIDSALLTRLKADTGPRLSYEQVAQQAQAQSAAPASGASGAGQFGGIVQQILPFVSSAIANSNNNNSGYYGPGPGYYGPPPGYNGYGYPRY
jgi:Putative peptidoglycan binding domain